MLAKTLFRSSPLSSLGRRSLQTTRAAPSEGAINASRGSISDKEKAVENQWAHQHDAEKIKKLREQLASHEKEAASLKKNLEDLEKGR
ncbi:hypothetical protein BDF14DRAFT_1804325 [Spinellus fusiger]|nr:hypothetical protein BDF14DRAFT_1804325 [Spinellus fusiger]